MQYLIFIFVIVVTFPNRCATLCGIICLILYDINYFIIIYITYSWEPKFNLVFDVGKVDVVIFDCCILWYDDKYYVYYTRLYFFMCTSDSLFERLLTFLKLIFFLSNLFDPGRSYCYWDSIKPCKSNEFIFMAYGSVTRG